MTGQAIRVLKWLLPIVVSIGAFWFLLGRIDLAAVIRDVDAGSAAILIPSVLLFGGVSLWLEAVSIDHLAATDSRRLGRWTCARMKAATYPLGLVNYALGAGGLTYLLRRRGGLPVSEAAGIVMLIALFDLGLLLVLSALGAVLLSTRTVALQAGVVAGGVMGIAAGFVFLRTSVSFGPLDRIRELELFRAARETPIDRLATLAFLRLAFVISFILVCGVALMAFGVRVPPGDLAVGVTAVSLVASLPIAVAGLGTGQVAFVYMFRHWAAPEVLLASNLALTATLILMRSGMGLLFAREFTRDALEGAREIGELGEFES